MKKYRIRAREIKEKIKYVKELLKRDLTPEEKEKIEISLVSYLSVLNLNSNTQILNFIENITNGRFNKDISKKYKCISEIIPNLIGQDYMDEQYLAFLLELINNIAIPFVDTQQFSHIDISEEQMMNMSKLFYDSLGDSDISKYFHQILENPNSITINPHVRNGNENFAGLAYYDHLYNQPYITTFKSNDINDFYILSHEIMHGIDFYMNPKLYSKTYYGFHETTTYTTEYMITDFLEQMGIDKVEIDKLRREKESYISVLAGQVQLQIRRRLRQKGIDIKNGYTVEEVKSILDLDLKKIMLEVESGVMAYGFYQQIKNDKQLGLSNLKRFMSSNISKDRAPDFTTYGLSNEILIELSHQMALEIKRKNQLENQEEIEQQNGLQQTNGYVRKLVKPSSHSRAFISSGLLVILISTISVISAIFLLIIIK